MRRTLSLRDPQVFEVGDSSSEGNFVTPANGSLMARHLETRE
jgi:hypothetical protein